MSMSTLSTCVHKQDTPFDTEFRLRRLISRAEPLVQQAFLRAVRDVRNIRTLAQIEQLLLSGDFNELFRPFGLLGQLISGASSTIFVTAAENTADLLFKVSDIPTVFDQTNFRAVSTMQNNRLTAVREFTAEQINATRAAITDGITRGLNPRQQAKAFRQSIGLTSNQLGSVGRFRELLESGSREVLSRQLRDKRFDRTIRAALSSKEPLDQSSINRMVERYQERFVRFRSEVIARTESLKSVHQGTEEMYEQAFDEGSLSRSDLIRTWVIGSQDRVRDSHDTMSGQEKPVGQAFVSGLGNRLMFPGDPSAPAEDIIQCRCVVTTRFR